MAKSVTAGVGGITLSPGTKAETSSSMALVRLDQNRA
jgi:hypothetical protein